MAKTSTPQTVYHHRQRDRGLAKVAVWVPETRRGEFWENVDKLKNKWRKDGVYTEQNGSGHPRKE